MNRYAIIDLGSNSVRMNIVHIEEDGYYYLLDQAKEMVRLSEGLEESGRLQEAPIQRTINTLKLFAKLIDAYGVTQVYALATAAVRSASNRQDFLDRSKGETGFDFTVLTGQEEAYYDYLGVVNTIDIEEGILIDIGGGSTELVHVENRKVVNAISMPFGSVILSEQFPQDVKGNTKKAKAFVNDQLDQVDWLEGLRDLPIIGLGGVVRTIAKVNRNLMGFPIMTLHNYRLNEEELKGFFAHIADSTIPQLRKTPGINAKRADIIKRGILPLELLVDRIGAKQVVISGNGLRDGWFYEKFLDSVGAPPIIQDVLDHSIENLAKRYTFNKHHALHVRKLSLALFDLLGPLHDFSGDERKLVYVASYLHDIGMHVEYFNHHMHGFYLTLHSRINGLTNTELVSAAMLVGMHRFDKLRIDPTDYELVVDKKAVKRLKDLSLFIALSEKLDRSESGVIEDVQVEFHGDAVVVGLYASAEPALEISAAMEYADKFGSIFGKKLIIRYEGQKRL